MSDMTLPPARPQNPSCGCCGDETRFDTASYQCEHCQIAFDADTLAASFINETATACAAPCENNWHAPRKIWTDSTMDCRPCQLPAGHRSMHWTGCTRRRISEPGSDV